MPKTISDKKFKCAYCDFIGTREELVTHTDSDHQDMIPKGYTAARVVFNNINHKDHGICIVCKRESPWNEKNWKYDRLCGRKICKDTLRKKYTENMVRVYNKENPLVGEGSDEQQAKMLANRKISGSYKFKDGGIRTYTGSYERKTLEFIDQVLGAKSDDVMTPGPVFEYEYQGKKLHWITDILYIPANLVIEVKDGGSNPNNRTMVSYREKQVEKEKMITELGTYNYLRLTNNNFEQLLYILAELKMQMIEDTEENRKVIIMINEEVGGIPPSTPFTPDSDNVYIVPYGFNNVFSDQIEDYGFMRSLEDNTILTIDENGYIKSNTISFLNNRKYSIYECNDANHTKLSTILSDYKNKSILEHGYFYKLLSDKDILTEDQIDYDNSFKQVNLETFEITNSIMIHTLLQEASDILNHDKLYIPVLESNIKNKLLREYNNLDIMQDIDGYFAINTDNKARTMSYENLSDISNLELHVLSNINNSNIPFVKESDINE